MRMSISPDISELSPGDEVELTVRMANDAAEEVTPTLELAGLSADLWRLAHPIPVIPAGQVGQTSIVIRVPVDTPPGDRRISVTVRSPLGAAASAAAALRVGAGDVLAVEASPQAVSGRKGAGLKAVVHNRGSEDLDLRISGHSDGARVQIKPAAFRLGAGQSTRVSARFTRTRRSWFAERKHGVVFELRGHTVPATTTAMFVQRPVVPPVLLRALAVLVALAVWASAVFVIFTNLSATEEASTDTSEVVDTGPLPPPPPVVLPDPDADPASLDGQVAPPVVIQGAVEGPRDPAGTTVVIERVSFGDQGTTQGTGKIAASATPVALTSGSVLDKVRTTTDEGGRFRVASGLRAGAFYRVSALRTGFEVRSVVVSTATSTEIDLALTLIPANGQLSGTVVDQDGAPLGGVTVEATQGLITYRTVTASSGEDRGRWTIDALATPATYLIAVRQVGFATQTLTVDLEGGQALGGVDAELTRNQGTIRGQITYRDAGVGAITVNLEGEGGSRVTTTLTDGALAGSFTIPSLPYGTYLLTFSGDGWMTQSREVVVAQGDVPVTVRDLVPSTGIVQGVVAQETVSGGCGYPDTTGGAPTGLVPRACGGVGVSVIGENGTWRTTTATADGSFRLSGIPAGEYTVKFERFGYLDEFYSVTVRPGDVLNVPANANYDAALAAALGGTDRPLSPLNVGQVQLRVQPAAPLDQGTVEGFLRDATDLDTAFDAAGSGREAWAGVCRTAMATILFVLDNGQTAAPAGCQLTSGGGFTLTGVASGVQRVRIEVPRFDRAEAVLRVNPEGITSVGIIALTPLASVALNVTGALDQAVTGAEVFIAPRPGAVGFVSDVAAGVTSCRVTNASGMWQVTTAATVGPAFRDGVCTSVAADGSASLDRSLGTGSYDIISPVNAADPVSASALATTVPLDHRQVVRAVDVRAGENVRLDLRLRRYGVILGSLTRPGGSGQVPLTSTSANPANFPSIPAGQTGIEFCEVDENAACVPFSDALVQPRLSFGPESGLPLGQYRIDRIPPNEGATLRNYFLRVDATEGLFIRSGETAITGVNFGSELIVNGAIAPEPINIGVEITGAGGATVAAFVRVRGVTELDGARTPPEVFSSCPDDCVNNDFGRGASVDAGAPTNLFDPSDATSVIDPADPQKQYLPTTNLATVRFLNIFRPIGETTFEIRAPGYVPRTVTLPTSNFVLGAGDVVTREIALTPEPRAVSGTVTVANGSVPTGLVATLTPCAGGAALSGPITAATGAFSFAAVTPANYRVSVSGPGIFPTEVACPGAGQPLTVPIGAGTYVLSPLQLAVASAITVNVTENNAAMTSGGLSIRLSGGPDNVTLTRSVCTTAEVSAGTCTTAGSAAFSELKPGSYTARVLGAGFVGADAAITAVSGQTATATIAVQRFPQITGRVIAKVSASDASGAPLAGADVELQLNGILATNAAGQPLRVVTDSQGRLSFPHTLEIPTVSAGSGYTVSISAPGYGPVAVDLTGVGLDLGTTHTLADQTLINLPVTVTGSISQAVAGGYVKVSLLGTNTFVTVSAASYTIEVPPRPGTLRYQEFDGSDQPTDRPVVERSVVGSAGQTLTENVTLSLAQGDLTGLVARADRSGAIAQNLPAGVVVTLSAGTQTVTVSTRSDGSFVGSQLGTGTYTIDVSFPGYGTSTVPGVVVVANGTTTVPTIVMLAELRDTAFTVASSAGGTAAVASVTVSARSEGQDDVVGVVAADGSVLLPGLRPGVWTVTTAGAPDLTQPHLNATEFTITVPAGSTSPPAQFTAPARTLQRYALIVGTAGFKDFDANTTSSVTFGTDATVSVTSAPVGSEIAAAVVTSSAQSFAVWVPVSGAWGLNIVADDYDSIARSVTVPLTGAGSVGVAVGTDLGAQVLNPSVRTVTVTVSSSVADATPVWSGLSLTLNPPNGSGLTPITGTLGAGNVFTFTGVRPATWTVTTAGAPSLVTASAVPRPHLDAVSTSAVPVGAGTVPHQVTLQRFGLITGTVTKGFAGGTVPAGWPTFQSSSGQITVSATPAGLPEPVTSISGNDYEIWVPADSATAAWTFGFSATHFTPVAPTITVADLDLDVVAPILMSPPPRPVVVPVASSPASADLSGVTVSATSVVNGVTVSATALVAGGTATFGSLVPGIWQVTTSGAPDLAVPHLDLGSATPITVLPGTGSVTVNGITLTRFGKITGTVELGFAGEGSAPTGWPVFGSAADGTAGQVAISAAPSPFANPVPEIVAGGFVVWVPTLTDAFNADWELGLQYPDFLTEVTTAAVSALGVDVPLQVLLQPLARSVTVTVTSNAGGALAGVTVSASSTVSGVPLTEEAVTDVSGQATFTLTPGKWVVTTSGAGDLGSPHVDRADLTPVVILPGGTPASVAIGLDQFRIVTGTVFAVSDVDVSLRTTVSGATVTATSSAGTVTTTTGADGTYSLTLDPTVQWTISVTDGAASSGTRVLAPGDDSVTGYELEIVTAGRTVSGTLSGADGRKVVIRYQANGYQAEQITLAAADPRSYSLANLSRSSTWTITFDLYKADGTTIERTITRWVGPGNENVVLNQDLAGAPAGNIRVRITDLGQAFDPGIRLADLHTQVTLRDFDGVNCLGVVRTTTYNVAQTAGDNVAMDVIVPMPTGQFCVKVTPYAGSPSAGGAITAAYQDPVTISAVTPDSGSPVNAVTVTPADQAVDATVMVTLRPRTRTVTFSDGSITQVTASAVSVNAVEYWPSQDLSNPSPANTFSNLRPGRWNAIGTASGPFAVPVGVGTLLIAGASFTDSTSADSLAFTESVVTGSATAVLPTLQVELRDASGLRITGDPGTPVTISATDGALLSGTLTRTSVNGLVSFTDLRIQDPGTFELSATDGTRSATVSVVVQQAVDAVAFVTQPADAVAGQTLNQIQVEVRDASGARLATYAGDVVLNLSAGTLSGTTTLSAVNGLATFTNLSITAAGTYTLTAAAGGVTATSASFAIEAAAASASVSVFQATVNEGSSPSTAALTVTVNDAFSNPRTQATDLVFFAVTTAPDGETATLSASSVTANGNGTAAATLEVSAGGDYGVVARLNAADGPVIATLTVTFPVVM